MFYFVTMALRSFDCFNFSFQVSQRSLRKYIGVVPQDTVLFNDTVRYSILCEFYCFFSTAPYGLVCVFGKRHICIFGIVFQFMFLPLNQLAFYKFTLAAYSSITDTAEKFPKHSEVVLKWS